MSKIVLWAFLLLGILATSVSMARKGDESVSYVAGPLNNVTAVMEGEALLPCDVSTDLEDDHPVLIMFYSNDSGTPIYTVDLRGRRLSQAKHQPLSVLKNRSTFRLSPGKSGLFLETVWSSDDGLYRCRVDFRKSPTRNSRIYLTVIVPPDSVRIVDTNGNEKSSTIGPYILGMSLVLKCIATGGRPPPKLTWSAGSKEVRGEVRIGDGEVSNTLTIASLQRHHLDQSFICQATNDELAVPVTAAVTVDMTLPPMSITLMGLDGPVSAGMGVAMRCLVVGARPEPTVTWWLDGRPLRSNAERLRDDNNVTESQMVLVTTPEDQGRYLSCRAETPGLLQSSLEDGDNLVVHYVPVVKLSLGKNLDLKGIKEGMDVFFLCSINAKPSPSVVDWYHNDNLLRSNTTKGVVVANMSLVLSKVTRYSSGSYTCRASNSQGQGVSRPIRLQVQYSPVCKTGQRWVYPIARKEMVHVSCEVDAHPKEVTFAWKFNNSVEISNIPQAHVTNNLTFSTLTYTPHTKMDYGFLLCWATNSVGKQREPCVFKIFPAGAPDALKNCTVLNESTDAVQVSCDEGFDGGLPQSFVMEVYGTGHKLKSNVTSKTAFFTVRGLPSGLALTINIYAANAKGRSEATVLSAATLQDLTAKHGDSAASGVAQASELPSTMELYPSLAIIMGVVGGILVVFVVIVVVMVVRRPRRENLQARLHQDDSSMHILKKDDSHSGRLDVDEKDPDVIPETRVASRRQEPGAGGTGDEVNGCELSELHVTTPAPPRTHDTLCPLHLGSRADLLERRGVADVSTIYDEMVATSPPDPTTAAAAAAAVAPITAAHPQDAPNGNNALANAYESTHATQAHVEPVHAHVESQQHAHAHAHAPQYIQHQQQHAHHHLPPQHQDFPASPPPPPMSPSSIPPDMHHSVSYHHLPPTSPLAPPDMRVVMPIRGAAGAPPPPGVAGGVGMVDPAAMLIKPNIPPQQPQQQQQQQQQAQHAYITTLPSDSIISSIPSSIPATAMYTHAHVMPPPVSHTMTLPHPRSSHARGHVAHAATLQRRSSLYMDPMTTPIVPPIAPPPAYDTPPASASPLAAPPPDMRVVMPRGETVCIKPNNNNTPPPSYVPPPDPPSTFSTPPNSDRMESSV